MGATGKAAMTMKLKVTGRSGDRIRNMEDWQKHGGPASSKHWKPGRSAYELAADWIERDAENRVIELVALLDEAHDLQLVHAAAEKKTRFDGHSGPRNHDLLIHARCEQGPVTIGIEAKADEPFDLPLWRYREEGLKLNPKTKKLARIDHLVKLWFSTRLKDDRTVPPLITLGYQLFSALAGTLADAKLDHSHLAILVIHEFRTHLTEDIGHEHNARIHDEFLLRLLGSDQKRRATSDKTGWITEPRPIKGDGIRMPVETRVAFGKIVRDLR